MSEHRNKLSSVGPLPMLTLFTTATGNRLLTFPRQESTITSRIIILCQGLRRTTYTVMLVSKSSIVKVINSRECTRRGGLLPSSTRMGLELNQ